MKIRYNRTLMAGVLTIVYALTLFCTAWTASVAAVSANNIRAFVDFENEYPDIENYFTVWGEYTGTAEDTIQIVSAVYDGNGKLLKTKIGDPVTLEPKGSFAVDDGITLDSDTDIEDAVLKVFIWDSKGGMQALGQNFRVTDVAFTYTLEDAARTSAGVYDADNRLIRALWSGTEEEAGTYTKTWDGCDEYGVLQAEGEYKIIVMENNVEVVADAYVGNTSDHSM